MNKIRIFGEIESGVQNGYVTSAKQIRNLQEFVRSYKNVELFYGFVEAGNSYQAQSLDLPVDGKAYYLTDKKIFAICHEGVYYNNWLHIQFTGYDFNDPNCGAPRTDRIFEDVNTGLRYIYDGNDLVEYAPES